jgi:hypothetical protein
VIAVVTVLAILGVGGRTPARARSVVAVGFAQWFLADVLWTLHGDRWAWSAALAVVAAVLVAGRLPKAAAAAVGPLALAMLLAVHSSPTMTCVALLLAAVAVAGMATVLDSRSPLDALAGALTLTATAYAVVADRPAYVSLGVLLLGAQLMLSGFGRRRPELKGVGALLFAAGLGTLPWTTGFVPWLVAGLAPHGVTGTDVAAAVLATALFVGGLYLRKVDPEQSSWMAYGPGLALAGVYLLSTQATAHQNGRVAVAVALGVVAVAAGGLRRLGAPLLLGTALLVASTLLASGHQLARLGVWAWLAVGGVSLIGLALLIEKRAMVAAPEDPDTAGPALDRDGERLVQVVWRRFS